MHGLLEPVLPARWIAVIRAETEAWPVECPCGYRQGLWSHSGLRHRATATNTVAGRWAGCGGMGWLTFWRDG